MFELYMWGTGKDGKEYPKRHMMGMCINALIGEYIRAFPPVVHVRMDVAIETHLIIEED